MTSIRIMRRNVLVVALSVANALLLAQNQTPARKAVAANGHIWLMDADGGLFVWNDSTVRREPLAGYIVDIARTASGTLVALRRPDAGIEGVLVERTIEGQWRPYARIRTTRFDKFVGLAVHGEYAAILTTGAVLLAHHGDSATRIVHGPIAVGPTQLVSSALTSDSNL